MKNLYLFCLFLFLTKTVSAYQGLGEIKGGISAAWTSSQPEIKDPESRFRSGAHLQLLTTSPGWSNLYLVSGMGLDMYGQTRASRVENNFKVENDTNFPPPSKPIHLTIPLKLRYQLDQGWNLILIETGPEWSYVLNHTSEVLVKNNNNLSDTDMGWALRFGYAKPIEGQYLTLFAEYYYGLAKINQFKTSTMENRSLRLGISYLFGWGYNLAPDRRLYED